MEPKSLKSIFEFSSYKSFILHWVDQGGRGAYKKIADAIGIHTSSLSQMIHGNKNLNSDHIIKLGEMMNLSPLEKDYLIALLMVDKAGNPNSKAYWERKVAETKERSQNISERVSPHTKLSDEQKAIFYSSWLYAAVHMMVSMENVNNASSISEKLKISPERTHLILEFLLNCGLIVLEEGVYSIGKTSTYLPHTSPLVSRHHQNWRVKALEHIESVNPVDELFYTCPMALSFEDAKKVRELAIKLSENAYNLVVSSPQSEVMYCLNLDLFKLFN